MNFIENAKVLTKHGKDEPFAGPPATPKQIEDFESALHIKFPASYKKFLLNFGVLDFEGFEFYGITPEGVHAKAIPCVLFATKDGIEKGQIDNKMIMVQESGYGPVYCIDFEIVNHKGEPAVVEVPISYKENKVVADSFADFFISKLKEAISQS